MLDITNETYHDADKAREHLEAIHWSDGSVSPHWGNSDSDRITKLKGKSTRPCVHKCKPKDRPMPLSDVPPPSQGPLNISKTLEDGVIASSLITAPAWSLLISEINDILTTLSLLIGLAIGLHRLWRIRNPKK